MYKYGELLVSQVDTEVEKALSGEKVKIPKGNKVVVGFDGLAHHIRNSCIQPFAEGTKIEGFCNDGIVEIVYLYLLNRLPLREMLDGFDLTADDVKDAIIEALEEIGLYSKKDQ